MLLASALCLLAVVSAVPVQRSVPDFVYPGDAPWTVSASTMAAALTCPNGYPSASSPPVLLVHGTFSTGEDSWPLTYVPALKRSGYTACWIDLPGRAGVDIQISAQYVAYNLHYLSQLSGGIKTAVVTHSQGGLDTQWAFEFWPSTWSVTSAFLPLAPDLLGLTWATPLFQAICPGYMCQPSIWQQLRGSHLEGALRANKNFKANVPTNAVWTADDEIVTPPRDNALLPGGNTVGVQELCPGRVIDHVYLIEDAAAYAIQLDALQHGGKADLGRILKANPSVCSQQYAPGMDPNGVSNLELLINGAVQGLLLGQPRVSKEPPLMPYAQSS